MVRTGRTHTHNDSEEAHHGRELGGRGQHRVQHAYY